LNWNYSKVKHGRVEIEINYNIKYSDGTLCEVVPNMHREITVFYACEENGNDNLASFEEISSCVYEMVVVTKWICSNPSYRYLK
jgi:endoplasmic reticulum lectin 1